MGTAHPCNSFLPYLGLCLLNFCFILLATAFIPPEYGLDFGPDDGHSFSYLVGATCDGVMGKKNLVGMPASTIQCVKVFIEQRGHEDIRNFMDVYISSLLFSTYLLHQVPRMLVQWEGFKRLCEIMFVIATTTESLVLVVSAFYVHGMWIRGDYVSSNPETILDEYNPFTSLYWNLMYGSAVLRGCNWIGLGVIIVLDIHGRLRDYSVSWSTFMHSPRFVSWTKRAYAFCFMVVLNFIMLVALYFYQRNELPVTDFSYLVGGDCDDVAGMTEEQYLALENRETMLCIDEFVKRLNDHDRTPGFMLCYLTVALFYVLLIIEALDFFSDEKRKVRAQLFTGSIVLVEAIAFMVLASMVIFPTTLSLVHNDVNAAMQKYYCWTMVWFRLAGMLAFYFMYLRDERNQRVEDGDAITDDHEEPQLNDDGVPTSRCVEL